MEEEKKSEGIIYYLGIIFICNCLFVVLNPFLMFCLILIPLTFENMFIYSLSLLMVPPSIVAISSNLIEMLVNKTNFSTRYMIGIYIKNFRKSFLVGTFNILVLFILTYDFSFVIQVRNLKEIFFLPLILLLLLLLVMNTYQLMYSTTFNSSLKQLLLGSFVSIFKYPVLSLKFLVVNTLTIIILLYRPFSIINLVIFGIQIYLNVIIFLNLRPILMEETHLKV